MMTAIGPVLHHVGIVVPDAAEMTAMLAVLGLTENFRGYVEAFEALCVFTHGHGATPIEFVIPTGGPLARFNKGHGGMHHLAYAVASLDAKAEDLARAGMAFIRPDHVEGAAGRFRCNFLSPVYTRGLTIEYVELADQVPAG